MTEKPKLDNARRLRGNYFIDPEDKEFKETIRNARKKLEMPMAPAMPSSNLNPASKEMISDSLELCETEVCFLHIQLIGTNV